MMKSRRQFVSITSKSACAIALPSFAATAQTSSSTGFVYDELYLQHVLRPDHPESPERLRRIRLELERQGLDHEVTAITRLEDDRSVMSHVESHHSARHVASIQKLPTAGQVAAAAVGGALAAVDAVAAQTLKNAFCAIRPPGHHANNTGREEGFCFYSTAAIAAKYENSIVNSALPWVTERRSVA